MIARGITRESVRATLRRGSVPVALAWVAAVGLASTPATVGALPGARLVLLVGCLTLVTTSGCASRDLRTGVAVLWLQTGVPMRLLALSRLAEATALNAVSAVGAAALFCLGDPASASVLLTTSLPLAVAVSAVTGCVVFAFSGWGIRIDLVPSLFVVLYLGALGQDAVLAPHQFPVWGGVLRLLRFPFLELHALASWSPAAALPWHAAGRSAAYAAAWIAAGVAGTEVMSRRLPAPAEE